MGQIDPFAKYGGQEVKTTMPTGDPFSKYGGTEVKKKVGTPASEPTSPSLILGGNQDQSSQTATNFTVATDPGLRAQLEAQQHNGEIDKMKRAADVYKSQLTPQERQSFDNAIAQRPADAMRASTADELASDKKWDTPMGKLAKGIAYISNKTGKGGLQIVKGGAWLLNHLNSGFQDTQTIPDEPLKSADNAIDKFTGITKSDEEKIENGKGMSTGLMRLGGMLGEFAPTIAGGEISQAPKTMFALQGFGQGKEEIDKADPEHKVNGTVRDGFVLLTGLANAALMGDAAETNFAKMPSALRSKVSSAIAMDALKQVGDKELTGDLAHKLINEGAKDFADNFYRLGTDYVAKVAKTGLDLSALSAANGTLKFGVNKASGTETFENPIGQAAEGVSNAMLTQAPILGAVGSVRDLSKLTPYSNFKNDIMSDVIADPNKVGEVKTAIEQHGQESGWSDGEVQATNAHIDAIADAARKLPTTIKPEKRADAVELVINRDGLRSELSAEQAKRGAMDESVSDIPTQHEQFLTDKIAQANDKLRAMATGKRTTYSKGTAEEEGSYFKTTDGVQEEIPQSRYELEALERGDDKQQSLPTVINPTIKEGTESTNAVQEQSTGEMGVRDAPEVREGLGGQDQPIESAKEGERSEIQEPPEGTSSIKNAKIDEDRAKRGLSPLMTEAARDFPKVWDGAMKQLDENPNEGRDLVDELHKNPRATTDTENALIAHTLVEAKNDFDRANDAIVKAQDAGEDTAPLDAKLDAVSDRLHKIEEVAKRTGTETARGLNSRKMMIKDDMSLASLETKKRVALGRKLTTEERADLRKVHEAFTEKEKAYETKIAELEQRNQKLQEDAQFRKLKHEAKKEGRAKTRSQRSENRQDIIQDIRNKLKASLKDTQATIVPYAKELAAITPDLLKLAKSYIEDGIDTLDGLVDKIHDDLKDVFDKLDKRAVRDAISGYGNISKLSQDEISVKLRELKAQARSISALEDAKQGERPLKSGLQHDKVSDVVRNLQAKVREAMKEMGIVVKTREEHLKTSLDAVKTRLKNQIRDLTHQIDTGEKPPEKSQIQYDPEANSLKSHRDKLKEQLGDLDKSGMSDAQKIKNALIATQKSIDEYNRRIKEKDLSPKQKGIGVTSVELESLRAERDKAKAEFDALKDAANPKLTPEQIALKSIKTRTANQIKEYERRLREKDFEPTPKKTPTQLDPEAIKAKADLQRVKDDFDAELEKDKLANRTGLEKGFDTFLKYRRAELLLNLSGAAKVGMASAYRILSQPLHELAGSAVRLALPGVSGKAAREGHGFVPDAELKALKTVWNGETLAEVKKKFQGKMDNLDTAFGDKKEHYDTNWLLDLAGNIHAAEKEFAKQNEFRRSVLLRTKWAQEHGVDTESPIVQLKIGYEALQDANRQIFMSDNLANSSYRVLLSYLEQNKKFPKTAQIAAGALKVLFPIVKVPTNYLVEKFQYTPILGATKALAIMSRGLEKMKPEEADYVLRVMKKQSVGAGLVALGYFNPDVFGGFHVPGQKRKDGDLAAGDIKLFGVNIPHYLTHTPLLTLLQLGASIRRAADGSKTPVSDIAMGTATDYAESTPFYETPKQAVRAMESANNMQQFIGGFVRGLIVPNIVTQAAKHYDTDSDGNPIKRSPKNVLEGVEEGIPGLRKNVPIANPHPNFNQIHVGNDAYKLNNDQLQERQKYYDAFMKSEGAKHILLSIAKSTNAEQKKKLQSKLKEMASKTSKLKILHKYHNAETGGYDLEKIDE